MRLQQITLGGEAIDQQILDALHGIFPTARMIHIYATTELGRCFSVSDGRAGFPAQLLEQPTAEGVELKVEDNQLFVRPAHAMEAYDRALPAADRFDPSGWFATGDLVRIEGDRVYFAGRRGDMINVGGNKVQPLEIENRLRGLPQIADVRVLAAPRPWPGNWSPARSCLGEAAVRTTSGWRSPRPVRTCPRSSGRD